VVTRPSEEQRRASSLEDSALASGVSSQLPEKETATSAEIRPMMKRLKDTQVFMSFYGRAVDENNAPVPGATVRIRYSYFDALRPDAMFGGTKELDLRTDDRGEFSIGPLRGYGVDVKVEKDGYYISPRNQHSFLYVNHPAGKNFRGDSAEPVVFRLWKKGAGVPLIKRYDKFGLRSDGTTVPIDLMRGTTNGPATDLVIEYWSGNAHKDEYRRFDWRVRIEAPEGGLTDNEEEFDFAAPERDYQRSYEIVLLKTATNWTDRASRKLFVKLRNGEMYGNIELTVMTGAEREARLYIDSQINPAASRNLEPDPSLLFRDLESYNAYMAKQKQATK